MKRTKKETTTTESSDISVKNDEICGMLFLDRVLVLPAMEGCELVAYYRVMWIEGDGCNIHIHRQGEKPICHTIGLNDFMNHMVEKHCPLFIRVHKSYAVNIMYLSKMRGNILYLKDNQEIPIGRVYHKKIEEHFDVIRKSTTKKNNKDK